MTDERQTYVNSEDPLDVHTLMVGWTASRRQAAEGVLALDVGSVRNLLEL